MARQESFFTPKRVVSGNDTGAISAPTTVTQINGVSSIELVQPPVANVVSTDGAIALVIDAQSVSNGTATLQPMAWNEQAQLWFNVGATIAVTAGMQSRTVVVNWASRYAYVYVTSLAVATVNLWVGMILQTGSGSRQ